MARVGRVVIADVAHHVTQRGRGRQYVLGTDAERCFYLELLRQAVRVHGLSILGYCLMSSHVHVVVVPRRAEDLAQAWHRVHGRYAAYWNVSHASCGHVWQGRFHSCPLDAGQLWAALRYTERNPVRAGMVEEATAWPWSSAAAHGGKADPDACLDMSLWSKSWRAETWREFLAQGETESELRAIRRSTYTGRPLGPASFTRELEERTQRQLTPKPRGRRRKAPAVAGAVPVDPSGPTTSKAA